MDKTILIVDDSAIMRETVSDYCLDLDYDAEVVGSGEEAVEIIKTKAFELVFLDVHMPGIDGLETLKRITELRPEQRVIFMTTDRGEELFEKTSSTGFKLAGFINKPFSLAVMTTCLRTVIELKGIFRHRKEGFE